MTMNSQQTPYGHQPPPAGGNRGVVIALAVVLVIAVVGVGAFLLLGRPKGVSEEQQRQAMEEMQPPRGQQPDQNPPQVPPTNQPEARQSEQGQLPVTPGRGQPSQGADQRQQDGEPPPSLPQQFAEFTLEKEQGATTKYVSENGKDVHVTYADYVTVDELTRKMGNPETIGDWVCEEKGTGRAGQVSCVGAAHGGTVAIVGSTEDYYTEDIASIGDDLMAAWR
ncbi:MAG: hypothetical protein Q4D89_06625 [Arachnia propionica]|uniref:hypothetical protein n=1 Tax=Arachnia propionica TaxID=1750 RepID=UPI0026F4BE3C|nr:hypothetical protein [Arachnia propionica]